MCSKARTAPSRGGSWRKQDLQQPWEPLEHTGEHELGHADGVGGGGPNGQPFQERLEQLKPDDYRVFLGYLKVA